MLHSTEEFQQTVTSFGKEIFEVIGKEQPSAFDKKFWSGRILEWSMTKPELKVNMFRLVGVLPDLRSSESIVRHVNEYLGKVGADIHGLIDWGVNVNPRSIRAKITAAIVRKSVEQMASQFIAGEHPKAALKQLKKLRGSGIAFTVDLLGEYCLSEQEANAYLNRYLEALDAFGERVPKWRESKPIIEEHPGEASPICMSVKLSALYSQCSALNFDRSVLVLSERLTAIARKAREVNASLYIDAEDMENNVVILETFFNVFGNEEFRSFPYPGIVLQAYAKDSESTLRKIIKFSKQRDTPVAVRIVKGAYWDFETVVSNQGNLPSPLFAQKESTDANFEKLSRIALDNSEYILPAFGSHNIRSLANACCYAEAIGVSKNNFEIQVLYGMADPIAQAFTSEGFLVRSYVPLGELIPGMGYLVRRLIENSSNESFLRNTFHESMDVDKLLSEPIMREAV